MEFGKAKWIGLVVPRGVWLRWYMTDSLRNVALIRPGLTPGPPSPSGKALATPHKLVVLYLSMIHGTTQSLPLGGMWTRSGRMRATYRKQSAVYQHNTARCGTTDPIILRSKTP